LREREKERGEKERERENPLAESLLSVEPNMGPVSQPGNQGLSRNQDQTLN